MNSLLTILFFFASLVGPVESSSLSPQSVQDFLNSNQVQATLTGAMRVSSDEPDAVATTGRSSVVLAMDISDSMYGVPLAEAQQMAHYLVKVFDEGTPISIVTFANTAQIAQPYTTNKRVLSEVISSLNTAGVTALYDGVYEAVNLTTTSDASNRVVILLSDGGEYGGQSDADRNDALKLAEQNNATIFTVGIGAWTDADYLRELATRTSGKLFEVAHVSELPDVYVPLVDQIAITESQAVAVIEQSSIPPLSTEAPVDNTPQVNQPAYPQSTRAFISDPVEDNPIEEDPVAEDTFEGVEPDITELAQPAQPVINRLGNTAVVVAIDVSDSMYGYPLQRASELTQDFVDDLDSSIPVAVVTFANKAQLAQDFTTNREDVKAVLGSLQTQGVTALYDGADLAVDIAASAGVANPIVVLLSDGSEYGEQSSATREQALTNAKANNVEIVAIGYGAWIDQEYLAVLTQGTGGSLLIAEKLDDMDLAYSNLTDQLSNATSAPILQSGTTDQPAEVFENTNDTVDVPIPAIESEIAELNLSGAAQGVFELEDSSLPGILSQPVTDAAAVDIPVETTGNTVDAEVATLESEMGISNNIMPISIDIVDDTEMLKADLTLNGFLLASFTEEPITYDLDLSMLSNGLYKLTLQLQDINGDIRFVNDEFEVNVVNYLPMLGSTTGGEEVAPDADTPVLDDTNAPRIVLVDEQANNLDFVYSLNDGLVHSSTLNVPEVVDPEKTETLGDILASPLEYIPEPVRIALTTPNPELVAAIIVIMTIVLLPPGIFTMYYMMYTWNHPDKLEESRSPKEFVEPQYSFTAILPARKEEEVIRQTIHTVNNIDYPDHLKEILIMIRDDDDDETIAEAHRAIEEIGKDNIRVITFTEGPKNKPNGLNRGLRAARNDVVCIFDAEDEPHPEIYHVINTVMIQKEADVVQSGVQLMNFKSTWFSAFNVLEYFFWFKSGLHAFTREFNVTPLGGNTVFFKRHWLEAINGWDESCLTEDADVGIRLTRLGAKIEIVYDERHATREETPDTVESFIKQRTRWVQGFYQIFFKGDWAKLPTLKQKVVASYILLNSLLQAAMLLFLPVGIYIAATQRIPVPLALLSYFPIYILVIQLVTNLIGIREFTSAYNKRLPLFFTLKMMIYYYPYQLMLAFAALRAVYRMAVGQAAWEKTSHSNLHRVAMGS